MQEGFERVRAMLPAHQAYQVKKWAEAAKVRLNARADEPDATPVVFSSEGALNKWGYPRVEVTLRPQFDEPYGWRAG